MLSKCNKQTYPPGNLFAYTYQVGGVHRQHSMSKKYQNQEQCSTISKTTWPDHGLQQRL